MLGKMRESDIKVLSSLGLNRSEAIVYLDLVRNSPSFPAEIAKRVGFHRPNVYDTLRILKSKGLVTVSISKKGKRFSALDPKKLKLYLKQQESELDDLISQLEKIPSKKNHIEDIAMYKGISIKKELFDLIDKKQPIYISVHPESNLLGSRFLKDLDKRRIKNKIPLKLLFSAKKTNILDDWKRKYAEVRYFSAFNDIFKVITILSGNSMYYIVEGDELTMIKITNSEIVNERKMHFDHSWKMCSYVV